MTKTGLQQLLEWYETEGVCDGDGKLIIEKARQLLSQEKPTAPACPTCGVGVKLTERRIDGNSTCFNGHTHKTKDFYRPSTQADIVGELKECLSGDNDYFRAFIPKKMIEEIIAKHEGPNDQD